MTGRMSDNPADSSLREQLQGPGGMGSATVTYIWPILKAWEAAARADEREKIAKAINAHRARGYWDAAFGAGYACGLKNATQIVRSAGVEPKEQQT